MGGFRVLLNLGNYYSDYRRKSWIYVDREHLKTISEVKKHICEVFAIDGEFEIFICDSYVPGTECLSIISEGDVLEIKNSVNAPDKTLTIGDASILEKAILHSSREGEMVSEGKRKRSKKRKGIAIEDVEDIVKSSDTVTMVPLPEKFHPECNSTMAAQKKQKKSIGESKASLISDELKNRGKKKSKQREENLWGAEEMMVSCPTVHRSKEEEYMVNDTVDSEDKVDERKSEVISLKFSIEDSKTRLGDLCTESDSIDISGITNVETSTVLSSQQSVFGNSLLEHTIDEGALNVAKCKSGSLDVPVKKRKRSRHRKRKPKNIPINNSPASDHKAKPSNGTLFPLSQSSPAVKSDSKIHLRFSDSEEDDKKCGVTASPASEMRKRDASGMMLPSESASVNSDPKNAAGEEMQNGLVKEVCGVEAASKESEVEPQKCDVDSPVVVLYAKEKVNGECRLNEKDLNASQVTTSCLQEPVKRSRKAVINTGLGATLAHLMKKTSQESVPRTKLCPSEAIVSCPVQPASLDKQTSKSKKFYNEFPIVEKYPREGDILAFKILKMNENYEPCISNFMEGAVTVCDKNQSTVMIRILDGANEMERGNGKFDLQLEEEEEVKNNDIILEVEWKDVIEPRLVFP